MDGEASSHEMNEPETSKSEAGDVLREAVPAVEPLQVNAARIITIGTAAWALALVVMLISWTWVRRHHHEQWMWTCVVGVLLGLLGLLLIARHRSLGRTK